VEIHRASKVLGEYWKEPEKAAGKAMEIARRLANLRLMEAR